MKAAAGSIAIICCLSLGLVMGLTHGLRGLFGPRSAVDTLRAISYHPIKQLNANA